MTHRLASPGRAGVGWLGVKGVSVLVRSLLAHGPALTIEATCPWYPFRLGCTTSAGPRRVAKRNTRRVGHTRSWKYLPSHEQRGSDDSGGETGRSSGLRFINAGRLSAVSQIDRLVPDEPWYYVRVITFGGLDPDNDNDVHGWIKGTEFMEYGVAEQP